MIKGFIFDLDGVITDTAEFHYIAWKKLADEMGWEFDREVNERLRGVSRLASLDIIAHHNGVNLAEEELLELADKKNRIYVESLNEITSDDYLPGAKQILEDLKNEGFKIGLGSASKNSKNVLNKLGALGYFDAIGDGHSVSNSKPAPDVFLYTSRELGLSPEECVVYEDAESGIDAAKTGGFHSVGIGPSDRVGHADVVFADMSEASVGAVKTHFKDLF